MQHHIFQELSQFRTLFSRQAAFVWFVVIIFGFLLRFDHHGVSSFVRWLHLPASAYPCILHFFHASSWSLGEVMMTWMTFCREKLPLVSHNGRLLAIGDGIKIPKESRCQPGIKQLRSPSQNQAKPQRFVGHHFGCAAFVAEQNNNFRAVLQVAQIHEGVDYLRQPQERETVVSRMMSMMLIIAMHHDLALYVALDALFSTAPAFHAVFHNVREDGTPWIHLITRAKSNYVAYTGAKRRKEERFKLWDVFEHLDWFSEHAHPLHPKRTVKLFQRDLYWGTASFFLRFVWVIDGDKRFVLMSSDISLDALTILKFYGLRFQIEQAFRVLKRIIGGFCYRFWSDTCQYVKSKKSLVPAESQAPETTEKAQLKLTAIERFVNLAIIAQGILDYLALVQTRWVWTVHQSGSWLRSYSSVLPSSEVVQRALQSSCLMSFSLQAVRHWVKSNRYPELPNKRRKVRKHHTLEHFLSG